MADNENNEQFYLKVKKNFQHNFGEGKMESFKKGEELEIDGFDDAFLKFAVDGKPQFIAIIQEGTNLEFTFAQYKGEETIPEKVEIAPSKTQEELDAEALRREEELMASAKKQPETAGSGEAGNSEEVTDQNNVGENTEDEDDFDGEPEPAKKPAQKGRGSATAKKK